LNVDCAHLSFPKVGETANGDRPFVRTEGATTLLAVIDGLGHGPGAAEVSQRAVDYLEAVSLDLEAHDLMEQLHGKLAGSRGVAATLCVLSTESVSVCAVGNVECRSLGTRLPLVFSPGILGLRVRKFRPCSVRIEVPTRLVLFSDGISSRVPVEEIKNLSPQHACESVIAKYRRNEDDSTVLIADVG